MAPFPGGLLWPPLTFATNAWPRIDRLPANFSLDHSGPRRPALARFPGFRGPSRSAPRSRVPETPGQGRLVTAAVGEDQEPPGHVARLLPEAPGCVPREACYQARHGAEPHDPGGPQRQGWQECSSICFTIYTKGRILRLLSQRAVQQQQAGQPVSRRDPRRIRDGEGSMRAVAITDDRSVAVVDIERPVPAAGEVLLDVAFCGICGSDLHMLHRRLGPG
jgi:hypothetical protein